MGCSGSKDVDEPEEAANRSPRRNEAPAKSALSTSKNNPFVKVSSNKMNSSFKLGGSFRASGNASMQSVDQDMLRAASLR